MASYFDDLNINASKTNARRKKHDVDLDNFMTPTSRSTPQSTYNNAEEERPEQLRNAANFFGQILQHPRIEGDHDQEQFLDNLVSRLLEESQADAKGPPPASKRFITALPRIKTTDIEAEKTCIICKETLRESKGKVTKMPCEHHFDQDCLVPWLELHNTCPLCRHKVETEQEAKEEAEEEERGLMYG